MKKPPMKKPPIQLCPEKCTIALLVYVAAQIALLGIIHKLATCAG